MLEFGAALPGIRRAIRRHLDDRGLTRDRVLAAAISLIDLGFFRPGGEEYLADNGTFGLATIRREHVTCRQNEIVFEYTAKGAKQRQQAVADDQVCAVVRGLKRRRWGGHELLAYRSGRGWHDVTATDLNDYLRELSGGGEFTVKDFRTWHATVLAAVGLAVSKTAGDTPTARKRAVARMVREVAGVPGRHSGGRPCLLYRPPRRRQIRAREDDRVRAGRARLEQRLWPAGYRGQRGARGAALARWLDSLLLAPGLAGLRRVGLAASVARTRPRAPEISEPGPQS